MKSQIVMACLFKHRYRSVPQPGPYGQPDDEANGHEGIQEGEAPGPGVGRGDVRHVGVGGEVEAGGAPGQVLQALQQQVLNLALSGGYTTQLSSGISFTFSSKNQ